MCNRLTSGLGLHLSGEAEGFEMGGGFNWFDGCGGRLVMAGEGGEDVSFCIGEYGDEGGVLSITVVTDAAVAIVNAVNVVITGVELYGTFPGFADVPENIGDGDAEFACTGVAWYFMIVPFENVYQCVYTEVITGFLQFLFAHVWKLAEGCSGKVADPLLHIGEGKKKAYEFLFVHKR